MRVVELNRDQLTQLKIEYYKNYLDQEKGEGISYEEMANIDDYVTDEEILGAYGGVDFVPEDFSGEEV